MSLPTAVNVPLAGVDNAEFAKLRSVASCADVRVPSAPLDATTVWPSTVTVNFEPFPIPVVPNSVVTATLDFENATDADTNNSYIFDVIYTSSTGDKFTESVTLNVTNGTEETDTLTTHANVTTPLASMAKSPASVPASDQVPP